ncbi:MAG TPA: response regulator [Arenimonas sp.]|nr:response regulator [Arenimonas sp.]
MDRQCIVAMDDDPDVRAFYAACLEAAGFDLVLAESSRDVLALVERHRPALVLSDLVMPDHEGMEGILNLISKHAVPILVVSGHRRFIELASPLVSATLLKPVTAEQLLDAVRSLLPGGTAQG